MEEDLGLSLPREINVAEELDESEQVKRIALALYQESLVFEQQALQSQQELHPNIVPLTASSSISEIHDQDQNVQGEVNMTGQGSPCSSAPCKSPSGEAESGGAGQSSSTASAGGAGAASAAAAADAAHEAAAPTGLPEILKSRLHVNWISLHPYVHLPVLQKGVVVPLIRLSPSDFQSTKNEPVLEILLLIRQLLIKKELNQADTALLATNVQQLAIKSAARARATRGMNHPAHVVSNIGQHFLALDAVVSALQVLRKSPPSSPWWEAFTESFGKSDQYLGILVTREGGKGRIDLTNRLLAAISIYKTGSRPELSEIVELKRLLFFSSFAPLSFKTSGWDPWRSAHLLFEREYPMFSEWLRRQRQPLH
ncbi:uncharacterized protein EMH_0083760 [Eimeria mitis]|uniref:Uncharacterized protein n=1 Tax=Eimeria mitis TaxID=44415 RepID=U6KER2_9EIME|nr:uncharacterized protein EMH_0083760 [Eimeria mitis]CDJ36414.1 hypothetical protein EMH_0083760 [Eimeria mitis]